MSIDNSMLSLATNTVALKLIDENNGTSTIPATSGGGGSSEHVSIPIPHNQGHDKIICRVMIVIPTYPTYNNYFVTPFAVSGLWCTPKIDATNLTIEVGQSGVSLPARNFSYYYRILVP